MNFNDSGTPIKNSDGGSGSIAVTNSVIVLKTVLAPPVGANRALLQFSAASGSSFSDANKIINIRLDDNNASTTTGFLFGDREFLMLESREAINQCTFISHEGSNQVNIWIQYIADY